MRKIVFYLFLILSCIISISYGDADTAWTSFTTEDGLYSNVVSSIAVDLDNIKWVGHQVSYSGISVFDNKKWRTFYQRYKGYESDDYHLGRVIAVDKNNVKWFSDHGDVVSYDYKYDAPDYVVRPVLEKHVVFSWEPKAAGDIIEILVDDNNIKWIVGQGDGFEFRAYVAQYDGENILYRNLIPEYYQILAYARSNDIQWASCSYSLYYYDGTQWNELTTKDGIPAVSFETMAFDKSGILWAGNRYAVSGFEIFTGLASFDGTIWKTYTPLNSGIISTNIYFIAVDCNNVKWLGTDAGVSRYDGETWTTFNTENSGLCNNKVNAIAFEKDHTIWFGTDNGISRYTGELIPVSVDEETRPEAVPTLKTYPNPFNPSTTIEFTLPEARFATVSLYNMAGQKIRDLTAGQMTAGTHRLQWDGKDNSSGAVSAGVYIARLKAGMMTATGKLVLVK